MTFPTLPTYRLSSLATEYIKVPVRLEENDQDKDPSASTVEFAYAADGVNPANGAWVAGTWEEGTDRFFARVLTGPAGAVNPGVGTWDLWVRITRSPEVVVQNAGQVVIT